MQRYGTIDKRVGETPLEATERFREARGIEPGVPLAYAGRLDPMAEGVLLILIGDECKRQEHYHALDKEYEFETLFGVATDTGDILGLITELGATMPDEGSIKKALEDLTGTITLPYPHFSAKTVHGKPLHVWTLEGKLDEIDIPARTSNVYALTLAGMRTLSGEMIARDALTRIETVTPVTEPQKALGRDFRRADVRNSWQRFQTEHEHDAYTIARIRATCSSGTYMRSLAEELARRLDTCALAYRIRRTRIGHYRTIGPWGFWQKTFV